MALSPTVMDSSVDAAYSRIAADFHRRIDCIVGAVDHMAPALEAASIQLLEAALTDGKVLVCGMGSDATLAMHVAGLLRAPHNGVPALPAIAVVASDAPVTESPLWLELRTLSRDGDVLLCVDSAEDAPLARLCAEFARQRNLRSIILSQAGDDLPGVSIQLQAGDRALRSELLLMACHSLQEQIKRVMLGDES